MKILMLTNENHVDFVLQQCQTNRNLSEFLIKSYGGYEWGGGEYDIGISFMYQYKVPTDQLNKPWFNFHPAPLPEYKGRNLCYHAIMNGEKEFGASLHYMDENFDTGDIIKVRKFDILSWMTAGDVSELALLTSEALFWEYLPRIARGENFTRDKNEGGHYYKKEPIEDFMGLTEYQDRKVRAITYGNFHPKIDVGGTTYKIVRDE